MSFQGYDPTGRLAALSPKERLRYLATQPGYTWMDPEARGSGYWDRLRAAMASGGAPPVVRLPRMSIEGNEMRGYSGINEESQANLDAERMWRGNVDPEAGPRGETWDEEMESSLGLRGGLGSRTADPVLREMYRNRSSRFYDPRTGRRR